MTIPAITQAEEDRVQAHAAHVGDLMEPIVATGSVSGELLGDPSAELRAKLADSEFRLSPPSSRCSHRSPVWGRLLRAVAWVQLPYTSSPQTKSSPIPSANASVRMSMASCPLVRKPDRP